MTQAMERPGADAPVVNGQHKARQPWPVEFYSTAVGKKWVIALTGIGLMGYVFAHMVGNLKMFLGRSEFDHYAESLRALLYPILPHHVPLWGMRIGLIVLFGFHIHSAYTLTRMNHRARPIKYQSPRDYIAVSFASRTMRWTGIIIGLYLIFHLADLTWGFANPDFVRGAAYDNLVASFERWPVAVIYILSNIAPQSCASVPPEPACMSRNALCESIFPANMRRNSSCSSSFVTPCTWPMTSAIVLESSSARASSCSSSASSSDLATRFSVATMASSSARSRPKFCARSGSDQTFGSSSSRLTSSRRSRFAS